MTTGQLISYTAFFWCYWSPRCFQIVAIGTQITEAITGLERTRENPRTKAKEDQDPQRSVILERIEGRVEFEDVHFSSSPGKEVLHGISFVAEPARSPRLWDPPAPANPPSSD